MRTSPASTSALGVWIGQGVRVGLIGATGDATGPHLHFEVRVRGASVDPLRALPSRRRSLEPRASAMRLSCTPAAPAPGSASCTLARGTRRS